MKTIGMKIEKVDSQRTCVKSSRDCNGQLSGKRAGPGSNCGRRLAWWIWWWRSLHLPRSPVSIFVDGVIAGMSRQLRIMMGMNHDIEAARNDGCTDCWKWRCKCVPRTGHKNALMGKALGQSRYTNSCGGYSNMIERHNHRHQHAGGWRWRLEPAVLRRGRLAYSENQGRH